MFIPELEHGIFYLDSQNHICFQCTDDLLVVPIKHLFHLHIEGLSHFELEKEYCVLISLELSRKLGELQIDEFRWVQPESLKEAKKFYNGSFDDTEEED